MENWVSPKQAARALGVSESSLKRWCDQGLLQVSRTAGGHRQLPIPEVVRFAREHEYLLQCPEILGLPPASPQSNLALGRAVPLLAEALLSGEELLARQIVFDLYLARHRLSVIFDEVIASAFYEIGDRWECDQADVYQERRGCEITQRILVDLRSLQSPQHVKWIAIGATLEGDHYSIPTTMVELVLRDCGWQATALGTSIPASSLVRAAEELRPELFWVSASHIQNPEEFLEGFAELSLACSKSDTALVVGGRSLSHEFRQKMKYSTFCDTMQHLEVFVETLHRHRGHRSSKNKE